MALPTIDAEAPDFVRRYVNLADARLGAQALACSDDFFAAMARMLNPEPALFIPGKYIRMENGWMAGKAGANAPAAMIGASCGSRGRV